MSLSRFLYVKPEHSEPLTHIGTVDEFAALLARIPGSCIVSQIITEEFDDIDRHAMLASSRKQCPYSDKMPFRHLRERWLETFELFERFDNQPIPEPAEPVKVKEAPLG